MDTEWWMVLRTDDLGNNFLVADGLKEEAAKTLLDKLVERAHKQTYFAESYSAAGRRDLLAKYNVQQ